MADKKHHKNKLTTRTNAMSTPSKATTAVRVMARFRPLNKQERNRSNDACVQFQPGKSQGRTRSQRRQNAKHSCTSPHRIQMLALGDTCSDVYFSFSLVSFPFLPPLTLFCFGVPPSKWSNTLPRPASTRTPLTVSFNPKPHSKKSMCKQLNPSPTPSCKATTVPSLPTDRRRRAKHLQ